MKLEDRLKYLQIQINSVYGSGINFDNKGLDVELFNSLFEERVSLKEKVIRIKKRKLKIKKILQIV